MEESPESRTRRRQQMRNQIAQITSQYDLSNCPRPQDISPNMLRDTYTYIPQAIERLPPQKLPSFTPPKRSVNPRNIFESQLRGIENQQLHDEEEPDQFYHVCDIDSTKAQNRNIHPEMMSTIDGEDMLADQDVPRELNLSHIAQEYEPVYKLPIMSEKEFENALQRPKTPQMCRIIPNNTYNLINLSREDRTTLNDENQDIFEQVTSISPFKPKDTSVIRGEISHNSNLIELHERENFPELFSPETYKITMVNFNYY